MKYIGIIPARYQSSRFPGKSIALLGGIPVVVHVYRRALLYPNWNKLVVATDDNRIIDVCNQYNVPCVLTKSTHTDCLDRAAEVSDKIDGDKYIIIQGDEPFFDASVLLNADLNHDINGFCTRIYHKHIIESPNIVKVVINCNMNAVYFSRSVIPNSFNIDNNAYFKQIGLYCFSREALRMFIVTPPSYLEMLEKVGLLRFIENGQVVHMASVDYEGIEIDTPDDLAAAEDLWNKKYCQ